ncbi:hypothetical protein [Persephonella sp. KM09-Lau-8]|uniref:hypothetical protein n=1 Tax=Persephonella sp. KM09-Lau-8 TaxID=1158345 RepID=UPI0004968E2B|nr:hypothetical protein [Persephonella sp. KM09-Lau-8]
MEKNLSSLIEKLEKSFNLISISEKPVMSILIFRDSPFVAVVDKEKNQKKLVLIEELVESFLENFEGKKESLTFVEKGLRAYNKKFKIYELPEKEYTLSYLKDSKIKKKKFLVPKRIWIIPENVKNFHKVFAIEKWEKENTILYQMPFPNTHTNGNICWGLNNKKTEIIKNPYQIDKIYFEQSVFTQDISSNLVYKTKEKTYNAMEFLENFNKVNNYKNLTPIGTLQEVIKLED